MAAEIETLDDIRRLLSKAFVRYVDHVSAKERFPKAAEIQALSSISGQLRRLIKDTGVKDNADLEEMSDEELKRETLRLIDSLPSGTRVPVPTDQV